MSVVTVGSEAKLNGLDVNELRAYIDSVDADETAADRAPKVTARWVGGTRAAVSSAAGGQPVFMGGDDDPSAMGMLLRALAACDIEVVVTRATLLGIEIQDLTIEATGYFNVASYLGVTAPVSSGYQRASYIVRMKVKDASAGQIEEIREALDASPVGDTFARAVPVTFELELI